MKKSSAILLLLGLSACSALQVSKAARVAPEVSSLPEPRELASLETVEAMHEFSAGLFRKSDEVRRWGDKYAKTPEEQAYELGRAAGLTEAAVEAARWDWGR